MFFFWSLRPPCCRQSSRRGSCRRTGWSVRWWRSTRTFCPTRTSWCTCTTSCTRDSPATTRWEPYMWKEQQITLTPVFPRRISVSQGDEGFSRCQRHLSIAIGKAMLCSFKYDTIWNVFCLFYIWAFDLEWLQFSLFRYFVGPCVAVLHTLAHTFTPSAAYLLGQPAPVCYITLCTCYRYW